MWGAFRRRVAMSLLTIDLHRTTAQNSESHGRQSAKSKPGRIWKLLVEQWIAECSAGPLSGKTFDEIVDEELRAGGAA